MQAVHDSYGALQLWFQRSSGLGSASLRPLFGLKKFIYNEELYMRTLLSPKAVWPF